LYESLSLSVRKTLHTQIAFSLEQKKTPDPEILAFHWERAENIRKSCEYYSKGKKQT
jgi:hypothetical protein